MSLALRPLVGLAFGGATLTEHDDAPAGTAVVGRPVWGSGRLLAELELRLGLPAPVESTAMRVQAWTQRLRELASARPCFYAASFEVDPLGTATTLLAWRDELVDAGWEGSAIEGGGERLATFAALEEGPVLPPSGPERLRRVEAELRRTRTAPLAGIDLAEPRTLWPGRHRRIFAMLEERGAEVRTLPPSFPGAPAHTDLGRVQSALQCGRVDGALRGDGSLVVLRAESSWELADALGALLRAFADPSTVLVRGGEHHALDAALVRHGLGSQGVVSWSRWRPALQVLPLAVELAFEPRDPRRVLELLTLPRGPFRGLAGRALADALGEMPGIGGKPWREAKEDLAARLRERVHERATASGADDDAASREADEAVARTLERIATWLEAPGHDAMRGAPREALLEVAARVRSWLRGRFIAARASADAEPDRRELATEASLVAAAVAHADSYHDALAHESREMLDLEAARQLLEEVALGGAPHVLGTERVGRLDVADAPASLRASRDTVVFWHAVAGTEWRPSPSPWRRHELDALRRAGVALVDRAERVAVEADGWRHAVLAAKKRLVLAIPRHSAGTPLDPHPLWDEIVARTGAKDADLARVTVDARELLGDARRSGPKLVRPEIADAGPLALPPARAAFTLTRGLVTRATRHSASSLETLLGCPLRWVLERRAGLYGGSSHALPSGVILNGKLGHRLVEELHERGALLDARRLPRELRRTLEQLVREEAAVLATPGMAFERAQLSAQITRSVTALAELLIASGLEVQGVEMATEAPWGDAELHGVLDLLLRDADGHDVVLDLKWGRTRYRDKLAAGLALQLAVYAMARKLATKSRALPHAAYFSLSTGELLATEPGPFADPAVVEGPSLSETWSRVERSVARVERALANGTVPVTGVRASLPLLDALGVPERDTGKHLAFEGGSACDYCHHAALCGRAWEDLE